MAKGEGKKNRVSMVLIQDKDRIGRELNDSEKEKVYQAFRRRALKKSMHTYVDLGQRPEQLRLYLLGSKFDSTVEFLVKVKSFQPIMGKSDGTENTEIGFTVELKSILIKGTIRLEVFRRQFKATLIIPDGATAYVLGGHTQQGKGHSCPFSLFKLPYLVLGIDYILHSFHHSRKRFLSGVRYVVLRDMLRAWE